MGSSSNPLTEYNKAFKSLQTQHSTNPIMGSEPLSLTTPAISRHQPEIVPNSHVIPLIAVLDNAPEVINLDGVDSKGKGEGGKKIDCEDSMLELDDGDVTLERWELKMLHLIWIQGAEWMQRMMGSASRVTGRRKHQRLSLAVSSTMLTNVF